MPPPKKPKSGRTSLEQFLSDEERSTLTARREGQRDSEGNSPAASLDLEGSDGEVFEGKLTSLDAGRDKEAEETRAGLFQKLFRKSHSVDEQKVPGSPEGDVPSPTSSPGREPDRLAAFRKYQEHLQAAIIRSANVKGEKDGVAPGSSRYEGVESGEERRAGSASPQGQQPGLSADHGRLIDSLVASALASSAAQSIIYSQRATHEPQYTRGHGLADPRLNTFDAGPQDLSKRSEHDAKLLSPKFYDNINNTSDPSQLSQAYRDWYGSREGKDVTVERNKHYLESHRNIVELLSERGGGDSQRGGDRTSVQIMEKENIVQTVPARYPNGFFHVGLNYSRYEHHQRFVHKQLSG